MPKTISKTVYTFGELLAAYNDPDNENVSSRAVEKARAWLQEGQTDHEWWEYTYDVWKQALEQVGFEYADIRFSGFWSPGDGASFTAHLDIGKLIAFLSTDIEAQDCISGTEDGENFLNYVVHKLVKGGHGKLTDAKFADLRHVLDYLTGSVERGRYGGNSVHEGTCYTDIEYDTPDDEVVELLITVCLEDVISDFEKAVEELRKDLCKVIHRELEAEYDWLTADEQLIETSDANGYTFDENGNQE